MIILKSLKINNFLSHSDTEISFKDNTKLLIDGKSGSGKSSIVEAILWGLYGVARTENRNLVRNGEKSCSVIIILFNEDENKFYEIRRSTTEKSKNTLIVSQSEDGIVYIPIEHNGIKDTQNWIENDLLHASYTLFINSIAYPQDNIDNFVKQTASKRKDLLLEIANIKDFDLYYTRARDLLSLKNEEKIRIETTIKNNIKFLEDHKVNLINEETVSTEIDLVSNHIAKYRSDLEILMGEKSKLGDFSSHISKLKIQIVENEKERHLLNSQIESKEKLVSEIESINLIEIKAKIAEGETIKARKEELENKSYKEGERTNKLLAIMADKPVDRDYDSEVMELNKRLIPLIKDTGSCPAGDSCPFVIPIKNQIKYLEDLIHEKIVLKTKLDKDKADYSQKIIDLGPSLFTELEKVELQSLRSQTASYGAYSVKLAQLEAQIETLPSIKEELVNLYSRVNKVKTTGDELNLELTQKEEAQRGVDTTVFDVREKDIRSKIEDLTVQLSSMNFKLSLSRDTRSKISSIELDIKNDQEKITLLEVIIDDLYSIKEAFGSKGLKTVVIDYLIPRLEEKINEILSRLSEFRVRLDTQKSHSDGEGVIEGLFINIFNERNEQFEFSSYSGGERLKISVAISEALASLQKCGFRIFDELFIGLDEESIEHFADVMNQLQDKFKQMLCISHLRTIKDLFDEKVSITKINGVSKIIDEQAK